VFRSFLYLHQGENRQKKCIKYFVYIVIENAARAHVLYVWPVKFRECVLQSHHQRIRLQKRFNKLFSLIHSSLKSLLEFACVICRNSQELLLWINKCTMESFVALGMRSDGNARKMEYQQLILPTQQCSGTPVGFGQWLLSKEQCDNTGVYPIFSWFWSSWLLPALSAEIRIEGAALLWSYWHTRNKERDGGAEKTFTKRLCL
jgi:hypothetical protein